jgi:hypothetical protein
LIGITKGGDCGTDVHIVPSFCLIGNCNSFFRIQDISADYRSLFLRLGGQNRSWTSLFIPEGHPLECLGKYTEFVSEGWVRLEGGQQIRLYGFVYASTKMGFKDLRDSSYMEGSNIGRVERKQFVEARLSPWAWCQSSWQSSVPLRKLDLI